PAQPPPRYLPPTPSFASGRYGLAVYVSTTCLKNSREVSHFLALSASVPLSNRNLSGSVVPAGTVPRGFEAHAFAAASARTAAHTRTPDVRCLITIVQSTTDTRPPGPL